MTNPIYPYVMSLLVNTACLVFGIRWVLQTAREYEANE